MKSPLLVPAFFKNESSRNVLELNKIDDFIILIITRPYLQNSCHKQIIKFTLCDRNEEVKEVVNDYPINDQFLLHIETSQSILHYSADPLIQSFTLYVKPTISKLLLYLFSLSLFCLLDFLTALFFFEL